MEAFNWGIIGPGQIAHIFAHDLKYITAVPNKVVAVLGHTSEKDKEFGEKFGTGKVFSDIKQFITAGIEAVYIATPHTLHHEAALTCLQHKIPVLCEKPITINCKQLDELIGMSQSNSVFLVEGMWIRFLPSIKKVVELIEQNSIGKVLSVKANISYQAPYDKDNRYFNPGLGGGSLLDLGVYPVFLATLLMGKPSAIKAVAYITEEGVDKACSILTDYEEDQYASLESSLIIQSDDQVAEIAGEKRYYKDP